MTADADAATVVLILALLALYAVAALPAVRSLELRHFLKLFDWLVPDRGDGRASGSDGAASGRGSG